MQIRLVSINKPSPTLVLALLGNRSTDRALTRANDQDQRQVLPEHHAELAEATSVECIRSGVDYL